MNDLEEQLDRLNELLNGIPVEREAMSLSQLDGYVAALVVCPEPVPPSEWLPHVWGGDGMFGTAEEAAETVAAVMDHYDRVGQELSDDPGAYAPILAFDPEEEEVWWEAWVDGFERGMRLRPARWEEIALSDDAEASDSVTMMITMHGILTGRSELTDEVVEEIACLAPVLIPIMVTHLNAWTKSQGSGHMAGGVVIGAWFETGDPPSFGLRAGGDEPCPCGSGRRYRRCCGAN